MPQLTTGHTVGRKPAQITPNPDSPQRLVDIAAKRAEGKGIGYERWAKTFNLKQMAKTMNFLSEHGFASPEEVDAAFGSRHFRAARRRGKAERTGIQESPPTRNSCTRSAFTAETKPAHDGLKTAKKPERYREAFHADLTLYEAAVRYFRATGLEEAARRFQSCKRKMKP